MCLHLMYTFCVNILIAPVPDSTAQVFNTIPIIPVPPLIMTLIEVVSPNMN